MNRFPEADSTETPAEGGPMTKEHQDAPSTDGLSTPVARAAVSCTVVDKPLMPAQEGMCRECPLRKANYENPDLENFYHRTSAMNSWRTIREGKFHACHMFDQDTYTITEDQKESGLFHEPVDIGANRECAGAVVALAREAELAETFPTHEAYVQDRRLGSLSPEAISIFNARREGRSPLPLNIPSGVDPDEVLNPLDDFSDISLSDVLPRSVIGDVMASAPDLTENCDCPTCKAHMGLHEYKRLTTATGETVPVDAGLWALLDRLAGAGIGTTYSCINMLEVMGKADPARVEELRNGNDPLNFRRVIAEGIAFLRMQAVTPREKAFIAEAERVPGVTTQQYGGFAQVEFADTAIPELMKALQRVTLINKPRAERGK